MIVGGGVVPVEGTFIHPLHTTEVTYLSLFPHLAAGPS